MARTLRARLPFPTPFFYGWVIVGCATTATFMSGPGQTYGMALLVASMREDLGWSAGLTSALYTAGSLVAAPALLVIGRATDRLGARWTLAAVSLLLAGAAAGMSRATEPWQVFVWFAALRAFGQGGLPLVAAVLVSTWFVRRRGPALAAQRLGMAASQGVFPLLTYGLSAALGWRSAWVWLAGLVVASVAVPAAWLVRRSPEAVGLAPDGAPQVAADASPAGEPLWSLGTALRTGTFWLLLLAGVAQPLVNTALVFHHVPLLAARGVGTEAAAASLGLMGPAMIAATVGCGALAGRVPVRALLAGGQILLAAALALGTVLANELGAYTYGALIGAASGMLTTSYSLAWPVYFGRTNLGAIQGAATVGMVAAAALGPLPFGLLADATGGYTLALLLALPLPIVCGVAALAAAPPHATPGGRHATAG